MSVFLEFVFFINKLTALTVNVFAALHLIKMNLKFNQFIWMGTAWEYS